MDWYVIQAYSGYEQKVKAALEERIALNNLSEKFGEILIPTEQIVELKGGEKKNNRKEVFPWLYISSNEFRR
jgi:transcriptional antiterminator NusG